MISKKTFFMSVLLLPSVMVGMSDILRRTGGTSYKAVKTKRCFSTNNNLDQYPEAFKAGAGLMFGAPLGVCVGFGSALAIGNTAWNGPARTYQDGRFRHNVVFTCTAGGALGGTNGFMKHLCDASPKCRAMTCVGLSGLIAARALVRNSAESVL